MSAPHTGTITGWMSKLASSATTLNYSLPLLGTETSHPASFWMVGIPLGLSLFFIALGMNERPVRKMKLSQMSKRSIVLAVMASLCAVVFLSSIAHAIRSIDRFVANRSTSDVFFADVISEVSSIHHISTQLRHSAFELIAELDAGTVYERMRWRESAQTGLAQIEAATKTVNLIDGFHHNPIEYLLEHMSAWKTEVFLYGTAFVCFVIWGGALWRSKTVTSRQRGVHLTGCACFLALGMIVFIDDMLTASLLCQVGPELLSVHWISAKTASWWLCMPDGRNANTASVGSLQLVKGALTLVLGDTGPHSKDVSTAIASTRWVQDMAEVVAAQADAQPARIAAQQLSGNASVLLERLDVLQEKVSCSAFYSKVSSPLYYETCTALPSFLMIGFVSIFLFCLLVSVLFYILVKARRRVKTKDDPPNEPPIEGGDPPNEPQIEGQPPSFFNSELHRRRVVGGAMRLFDHSTGGWTTSVPLPLPPDAY